MTSLGAFVVTLNGAATIAPVIRALQMIAVDVLVAIDADTTDDTEQVVQSTGCRYWIRPLPMHSYEAALNDCVALLNTDYVFYLHDDEMITRPFIERMPVWLHSGQAWRFPHFNVWGDRWHYISSEPHYPDYQLRLIPRMTWLNSGGWQERVHASPAWSCRFSDVGIVHYKLLRDEAVRQERLDGWIAGWDRAGDAHYRAFSFPDEAKMTVEPLPMEYHA